MFAKQHQNYQKQLIWLESLTPALLTLHGIVMLTALGGSPATWGLIALTAALGAVSFIFWQLKVDFTLIRAGCLLVFGFLLLLTTGNADSFFLLWYFVIVAIYPIVLRFPYNLIFPFLM